MECKPGAVMRTAAAVVKWKVSKVEAASVVVVVVVEWVQ